MRYSQLCSYIAMITCTVFYIALYCIYSSNSINVQDKDISTIDRDGSSTVDDHKSYNLTYKASMSGKRIISSPSALSSRTETHGTGNVTWKEMHTTSAALSVLKTTPQVAHTQKIADSLVHGKSKVPLTAPNVHTKLESSSVDKQMAVKKTESTKSTAAALKKTESTKPTAAALKKTESTKPIAAAVKKTESVNAILKKAPEATTTVAQSTEVRPQLLLMSASDKLKYFDWKFYQRTNPDLWSAGVVSESQLLQHFKSYGLQEHRWCSPIEKPVEAACLRVIYVFPPKQFRYYCDSYPIFHPYSLTKRLQEKMVLFDWKFYLKHNPDLKSANIVTEEQAAGHYKPYGYFDRRWSNATEQPTLGSCIRAKDVLTPSEYATICSEESIAKSDFTIFETSIFRESSSFSSSYNNSSSSSIQALDSDRRSKNPLLQEKLKKFDWKFYLKSNPDLVAAGLKTKREAVRHYWKHGFKENRLSSSSDAISNR